MNSDFGRILIGLGLLFVVVGLFVLYGPRVPWLGRLPGDIHIQRENFSFHFPITTLLLLNLALFLLLRLFRR